MSINDLIDPALVLRPDKAGSAMRLFDSAGCERLTEPCPHCHQQFHKVVKCFGFALVECPQLKGMEHFIWNP